MRLILFTMVANFAFIDSGTIPRREGEKKKNLEAIDHRCILTALSKIANVRWSNDVKGRMQLNNFNSSTSTFNRIDENLDFGGSTKRTNERTYNCRAIRDVYVPQIRKMMPGYECKFGDKMFVLASTRFLEDRRARVNVDVNEDMLRGVKEGKSKRGTAVPAMLVLKRGAENYAIRASQNNNVTVEESN